ncbi:MAG: hypothetical protein RBG13Loki_2251 [Promethearchaeota archaeon CR_4]|nr:MAG: hypothetical protein RBG13Loki_2251 [Candidatus Lokiarchaeota archaeon CR_4]
MDIFKAKEKYGDRFTLIGNVSPQELASQTPTATFTFTQKLPTKLKPGGGYILSSGYSINPAETLENWLAMREACAQFGSYRQ